MKAAIIVASAIVLHFMACPAAAIGPPPVLALELVPASTDVDTNGTAAVSIVFNGTATVTLGRFDRSTYTVSLAASVDAGWVCSVSPSTMTFSDSGTQKFNCTVEIPPATGNVTANLTVDGRIGGAFSTSASASSRIQVDSPLAAGRGRVTVNVQGPAGGDIIPYLATALVLGAAGASWLAYLRFFRKKKAP